MYVSPNLLKLEIWNGVNKHAPYQSFNEFGEDFLLLLKAYQWMGKYYSHPTTNCASPKTLYPVPHVTRAKNIIFPWIPWNMIT